MTVVSTGEIELDYERSGSGPPLLLIMGMAGTALHWGEPFLDALRSDFEVIVYDHRGVGASSRVEGALTIGELAADAAGLLTALHIDSAHVMGISMGGMVAQELTLAHPGLVRTLTLGATTAQGAGSPPPAPAVMEGLRAEAMTGSREGITRLAWELNVSPRFATDDEAWARFLAAGERRVVALPVMMAQLRAVIEFDTRSRLGQLKLPTLVMHGTFDEVISVANGRTLAKLIPGARLEIFDGAGHLFFLESPERSAELVRAHAAVHV